MPPTHGEFRQLWALAQSRGLKIVEDHNYRFNEPVQAIEKMMRQGELGEIREVDVRMALAIRKAGGRHMPIPACRIRAIAFPPGSCTNSSPNLCYSTLRFLPSFELRRGGVEQSAAARGRSSMMIWTRAGNRRAESACPPPLYLPCFARLLYTDGAWHAGGGPRLICFSLICGRSCRGKGEGGLSPLVNQFANGATLMKAGMTGLRNKIMQKTAYEGLRIFLDQTYDALRLGHEPPVTFDDMDRAGRLIEALLDDRNRMCFSSERAVSTTNVGRDLSRRVPYARRRIRRG